MHLDDKWTKWTKTFIEKILILNPVEHCDYILKDAELVVVVDAIGAAVVGAGVVVAGG